MRDDKGAGYKNFVLISPYRSSNSVHEGVDIDNTPFLLDNFKINMKWVSIVAIIISTIALGFSWYSYFQLLPLQQADVVFSESDIRTLPDGILPGTSNPGDVFVPVISNIGKASARNIHFSIFGIPSFAPTSTVEIFNDGLLVPLEPGEKVGFGNFEVQYQSTTGFNLKNLPYYLIFHLSYIDSLTGNEQNEFSMYKYEIGHSDSLTVLIGADYKNIYQGILSSITSSTDKNLNEYLESNPPKF